MKIKNQSLIYFIAIVLTALPAIGIASPPATSTVGVSGYDLVSYHTGAKPQRGNGNHVAVYDGVTYLFTSEANRKAFMADSVKDLPAYGGYCAYGVAVGKKFVSDPDVWEIVDGRLFLNLDNKIKGIWMKDIGGHIQKADAAWPRIAAKDPAEL